MRSGKKASGPKVSSEKTSVGSNSRAVHDSEMARLESLRKKVGNVEMDAKLRAASNDRDQMLGFICERLNSLRNVQLLELDVMKDERKWFRAVAKGKQGFGLPDATRWHEAARLHKSAALALCNGHLGRGADILEQALKAERDAFAQVPKQVRDKMDRTDARAGVGAPLMGNLTSGSGCPRVEQPKDLRIADLILKVSDVVEKSPPLRRPPKHWWQNKEETEEEDEEDES